MRMFFWQYYPYGRPERMEGKENQMRIAGLWWDYDFNGNVNLKGIAKK